MDPKLRQKDAANYLGVSVRTFRDYAIEPQLLPGRGTKLIQVWPVSRLEAFVDACNNPKSRKQLRKVRTA